MNTKKLSVEQFESLCENLFRRALSDVNEYGSHKETLSEPEDVSFASFKRYISENHGLLARQPSIELLSMNLYKKAIDDIAFQSDVFGFLLREIPIHVQIESCEQALTELEASVRQQNAQNL
jgi:hypothetical protein